MNGRRLTGLLLFGLLGACGFSADEASVVRLPPDACESPADCGSGMVCSGFQCVPTVDGLATFSVELRPPSGSSYASIQRLDLPLVEMSGGLDFRVPAPAVLELVVLDANGNRTEADVTLFGSTRIAGREVAASQRASSNPSVQQTLRVTEGDYTIRVKPTDTALPALEVRDFTVRREPRAVQKELRLPERYRRLTGEVVSSTQMSRKLDGVRVLTFAAKSGLASTVDVTELGDEGRYELLLPETDDEFFRVFASPPAEEQPAWGFEQIVRVELGRDRTRTIAIEPTDDTIRGTATISVFGTGADGRPTPVANAAVTLTATVTRIVEPPSYRIRGTTNADGIVEVLHRGTTTREIPILRARYVVEVVPPRTAAYAPKSSVVDFSNAGNHFTLDHQVRLSLRTHVSGTVVSAAGFPVANALVELVPRSALARATDAVTNGSGIFEADLDPGPYVMVIRPLADAAGGQFVPVATRNVEIIEAAQQEFAHVFMPRALSVGGTVRADDTSLPIPRTAVEVFTVASGLTVSLGTAETNANGWFQMVLPDPGPP